LVLPRRAQVEQQRRQHREGVVEVAGFGIDRFDLDPLVSVASSTC